MSTEHERSHLLIGMVLADVFLLMLLLVWWGHKAEKEGPTPTAELMRLRSENTRLAEEARRLAKELDDQEELKARYAAMKRILESLYLKAGYGSADVGSVGADALLAALRRGAPACSSAGENVALRVLADDDGDTAYLLSEDFRRLVLDAPVGTGAVQVVLKGAAIDGLLEKVRQFYESRRAAKGECRFDYSLTWTTDGSYRRARERYERVFYPARVLKRTVS